MLSLPVLVTLPSSITITTHWSAVLSGWIVQVTVMECTSLVALGAFSTVVASDTEVPENWKSFVTSYVYTYILKYFLVYGSFNGAKCRHTVESGY